MKLRMFCSTFDIIVLFHPTLLPAGPGRVRPNVSVTTARWTQFILILGFTRVKIVFRL